MNDFALYFVTGWQHIISYNALDHIVFIVALTAIYSAANYKQVLILVTAFTIGHSFTLALSVYDIIRLNTKLVEFLIPCTILTTAFSNFFIKDFKPKSLNLNYILALFFGFIHGMGFANSIRFMLMKGDKIAWPLFSFNLGLEAGQILIVAIILSISYISVNVAGLKRKYWSWGLSFIAIGIATKMVFERF